MTHYKLGKNVSRRTSKPIITKKFTLIIYTGGTNTLTLPVGVDTLEYLIVAGGGSGGNGCGQGGGGGSGGAGGYLTGTINSPSAGNYTIIVGAGGINLNGGHNGDNSSAFGLIAIGGGKGNDACGQFGFNGGSGGGAGGDYDDNFFGSGTTGQGFNGGRSRKRVAGGGGGAGGAGKSGAGGIGLSSPISGRLVTYATGGTTASAPASGANGTTNSGNGGNGGSSIGIGGNGGSGIVIVKYYVLV